MRFPAWQRPTTGLRASGLGSRSQLWGCSGLASFVLATAALALSCGEGNPGTDPPNDSFLFPAGVLLDPRVSDAPGAECTVDADCGSDDLCGGGGLCRTPAQWLFVTNANSDRRFNAGWMTAVDLDAFWAAAFPDPATDPGAVQDIGGAGASVDAQTPCRRIAGRPQAVECIEAPFIREDATVHFGDFAGPATAWDRDPGDDEAMILIPVRGDPSITYLDLSGGLGSGAPKLECEQSGDADGGRYCGDKHRLRFLRNDPDAARISREPFRIRVSPQADLPLAYITHQLDPDLTLMDLDGLEVGGDGRPAIVHQSNVFQVSSGFPGGFGLAQRPCDPDPDTGNAPLSTLGCTRPMVYSSLRFQDPMAIDVFSALQVEPFEHQQCVGPEDIGLAGGILCDYQVQVLGRYGLQGLWTGAVPQTSPRLADIAFTTDGDELYVLQSNPGALLRVDTTLDTDGEPLNMSVGQVEVCSQPTSMVIYSDGETPYGLVTCYRSAELFIVDLSSLSVAGVARAGIGPDQLEVDYAREAVYVANTLDATLSVIDMARTSPSRFTEIGRIGLSEPYTQ